MRLFKSRILRIEDGDCEETSTCRSPEEYAFRYEVVFLKRGTFVRHDASGDVVADTNHVLFFYPGQAYQVSHPVPGGDSCTIFSLDLPVLIGLLRAFDPSAADHQENPFPGSSAVIQSKQTLMKFRLLHAAVQTMDALAVEEQSLLLMGEIFSTGRPILSSDAVVNDTKLMLAKHFREKLTLEQISQAVYTSPYHLCRVFKQKTGLSIHRYLQRLRLMGALNYLMDCPAANLMDVALMYGFSSHSHFSSTMRHELGMTPSEYRRSYNGRKK